MSTRAVDLILIYQFLKRLTTPFNKTDAYELGLIDEKGKRTDKKIETKEEENAYGYFDRLVFNIKRLIEKVPGGSSRLGSYAAALFLIKESVNPKQKYTELELVEGWVGTMKELEETTNKSLKDLLEEDAPANSTGSSVAGTGDDKVHWKPDARKKEMKAFLKRYLEASAKRKKIKERKDFMKSLGL
jgi:hypothetical protein